MKKIPVVTRNEQFIQTLELAAPLFSEDFTLHFFTECRDAIIFLNYEIPEVKILDFTDPQLGCAEIADAIRKDSWLHPGGIIAIVQDEAEKQAMEENQDASLLLVLSVSTFLRNLDRFLHVLRQNSNFLFNRRMQLYLAERETGVLKCDNHPLDAILYANLLTSYLYNTNRIDKTGRYRLKTALTEMLFNALEHGNCGISYEQKTEYLENGGDILELIAEKNCDSEIANRKILIGYDIYSDKTRFSITDEGKGFDWRGRVEKKVTPGMHGMGIKMTANFVRKLAYNDKGNQVLFEIENQEYKQNSIPAIFREVQIVDYTAGKTVCREGDTSDDLFFILSGRLNVTSRDKLISTLSPNDIFIGEMSFLLDGRRSANIVAESDIRLIKIPKQEFMTLILQNPHYGVFLAKLLAQRLSLQNERYLRASEANEMLKQVAETILMD